MAGNYIRAAASLMSAHYAANFNTEVTAAGLAAEHLIPSANFLDYYAPGINRSPLLAVYPDGLATVDQPGGRVYNVPITTTLAYKSDADLSAAAAAVENYQTAMIRTVTNNYAALISAGLIAVRFVGVVPRESFGDRSATRHVTAAAWSVLVDEKEC